MPARALTSDELALLRSDGQWSKLYLAIYQPNTIYTALLNGVPASNDRVYQITYDGGTGTLANVKPGMTLWVGTSAGAYDLGMCRIRKTPGVATFYIGLTSEIVWADNCYLTVVDDFDMWAKHPSVSSGVLSMDVDIAYSDQHASFSPVPVLGSHACVWLDDATVDVLFDAGDSWVSGSTISTYAWSAPGSASIADDTTATPTITYDTAGRYCVYCTVTAANGKSTTGVRHVFVFDRDANPPATVFQLAQCVGDYDSGGYMFDMVMEAEATRAEIHDRALVVLFAEDWYGTTQQSIGPLANRENIVCVGRITGESIRWDREAGLVHFTVQGLQHWLSKLKTFPVDLTFVGAASAWDQMPALTVDRVLHHILYWRSTAIETMDFYPTESALYVPDGKTIASTIWGQLQDIANAREMAWAGVNRFGQLYVEIEPQMVAQASRTWATVMTLTDDDWTEGIELGRVTVHDCSLVSLSTHQCNAAGTVATLYSLSPGHVPLRYGEPEMSDRLLSSTQADSNHKAGRLLGWRLNEYPDVPVNLAMNNRMIDLFPRQFCSLTMTTSDNPRGAEFAGNLIPRRVTFYFDGEASWLHSEINFEDETFEQSAVNGDVPESESVDMSTPPLPSLPDLPTMDFPLPGFPSDTVEGPANVLIHDTSGGLLFTKKFNSESPTWLQWNTGLTTAQYQSINKIVVSPSGEIYVGKLYGTDSFLAYASGLGGTFTILEDPTSLAGITGNPTAGDSFVADFECNYLTGELVYLVDERNVHEYVFIGRGTSYTAGADYAVGGSGSSVSYGAGKWLVMTEQGGAAVWRVVLAANAGSVVISDVQFSYLYPSHVRISTSGNTIHYGDADLYIGTNNLTSKVTISAPANYGNGRVRAIDPTGQKIMSFESSSTARKSSDGGSSFSSVGTLPVAQSWGFAYAGGASANQSRWIGVSDGGYIYYTSDFWTTVHDKRGNLVQLIAIPHLDIVKTIGY